jgi:CRISPR-associated protein Csy2
MDRIKISGANAISSPITYGFPAITGFVGAVHALSRKIPSEQELALDGVLVASHDCQVNAYRPHDFADYTFVQARNPVKKNGETASIIEEGKVNLVVSLLIEVKASRQGRRQLGENESEFIAWAREQLMKQRIAGGSVQSIQQVKLFSRNTGEKEIFSNLLPAFVLTEAKSDLIAITQKMQEQNPQTTMLDALIEVGTLHHVPVTDDKGNVSWTTQSVKTGRGWLVPIPVGFQGINPAFDAGELTNCRSHEYPSQYTECLYSLGKWVFPYRLENIENCFWRYANVESDLYLVTQTKDQI